MKKYQIVNDVPVWGDVINDAVTQIKNCAVDTAGVAMAGENEFDPFKD